MTASRLWVKKSDGMWGTKSAPTSGFAFLLQSARVERKMSQTALAQAIFTNETHISRMEGGDRHPSIPKLIDIANVLFPDDENAKALFILRSTEAIARARQ